MLMHSALNPEPVNYVQVSLFCHLIFGIVVSYVCVEYLKMCLYIVVESSILSARIELRREHCVYGREITSCVVLVASSSGSSPALAGADALALGRAVGRAARRAARRAAGAAGALLPHARGREHLHGPRTSEVRGQSCSLYTYIYLRRYGVGTAGRGDSGKIVW